MKTLENRYCKEILIIEDDDGIRESLKFALELYGYEVSVAANGKEGLERLKTISKPCLILLDLMMPIMNGWQFAEALQEDMILAAIPIAVVTAFSERAKEVHAQAIVKKPVDVDALIKVVQQYCGGSIKEQAI